MTVSAMTASGVGSAFALAVRDGSASTLATSAAVPAASASTTESWTTLGSVVETKVVYSKPLVLKISELAWASAPTDEISQLMQGAIGRNSTPFWNASSLLDGLGAKLLDRFATTQDDFAQSVAAYTPNDVSRTGAADALTSAKDVKNSIGLKITTVSGKEVSISISFGGNGKSVNSSLSVEIEVDGELTDDERLAVAQLSAGFETALQGLSKRPPTVDFSGLVDYDASVLSGVDLSVRETPQLDSELKSLDFHADATQRSLSMETVSGKLAVSVDLSQLEILGSAAQQKEALDDYLARFDSANQRGHGDAKLIAQFKAAFSQLNSNYPGTDESLVTAMNAKDRSVLSGLADFTASMSGDFDNGAEGRVTTEVGHIDYRASQSTVISGSDKYSGLTVRQTQSTRLQADFVRSRNGLMLDTSSGNYDSFSIRDESSTTTTFTYAKDKLKNASIERLVKQLEHYEKFVGHKVVEERDTPRNEATRQDISARLLPSYKDANRLA